MSRWRCYNTREYFLNLIKWNKTFNSKPSANLKLNGEILNAFPRVQEQSKDAHSHYFHLAVYQKYLPIH